MSDELIAQWEAGGRKPLVFNAGTTNEIVICDPRRRMRKVGVPHSCDSEAAVSYGLRCAVCKKAMALNIVSVDDNDKEKRVERQAGLLLVGKNAAADGNDKGSPVFVPVTAKQNLSLMSEANQFPHASVRFSSDLTEPSAPIKTFRVRFDDEEITSAADIAIGSPTKAHDLTNPDRAFEKVRGDFQCRVGQKVGLAVWSEIGATPESAGAVGTPQARITEILGRPLSVVIYTGSIVHVGDDGVAIDHDANTYENCSGAILFLLDNNQPESVRPEDYGKAIAVHNEELSDACPRGNNVAVRL